MSEWQQVTLHEVCSFKRGLSYSGSDVKEDTPSGIPFITIKNFHKGGGFNFSGFKKYIGKNHADFTVSPGDLLIANTDVTRNADIIGSAIIAPEVDGDIAFSMDVTHLDVDKNKASPAFVCYRLLLDDAREHMKGASAGSTVLHLNLKQASAFPFKIPTKSEQKVIARILDTLDTQIQKTEALIAKLENVKEGLLHDLLTRGIDENGRLRPSPEQAPELYKDSPLGLIPREWSTANVGQEFEIQLGKMLDAERNSGEVKPYLGNKSVQWGVINISEVGQVRLTGSDLIKFRLVPGDLLVCEGGEVGRAALWEGQMDECYYQKALHRLRPKNNLLPKFMLQVLFLWGKRKTLSDYASQTSIAHLPKEKLEIVPVPVPGKHEQESICSALQTHGSILEAEVKALSEMHKIKSGLMDDLLTGRVRVTPLLEQAQAKATSPA